MRYSVTVKGKNYDVFIRYYRIAGKTYKRIVLKEDGKIIHYEVVPV